MKTGVIIGIVVVALALIFTFAFGGIFENNEPDLNVQVVEKSIGEIDNLDTLSNNIEITSSGFSPNILTINAGDTLTWVNKDTKNHWPASAVHPTHTVYPGSSISKCGTSEETTIFDSCRSLKTEESYSFIFNEVGTWKYHDHLHPSVTGTIIVN